jgi:phenylpropionate dioxygenase-like ring-hydroxylating dioxygenase large terminal subunit
MQPQPATPSPFTNFPAALTDPTLFREEQDRLARVWTFLGFTHHVAKDGDWFRATLANRSVFVQRFGAELRAFENRCAHRSFPLRTADRGNGPILCGFHHWRYDSDGRAVDIPECERLFGATPAEMGVRLMPVEIATCGEMIFGRFRAPGDNQSLEKFLGESFDILAAISRARQAPKLVRRVVEANWRLCFHANVEDYHPATIHQSTFGKEGYFKLKDVSYFRYGWHSAFFFNPAPDGLTTMAAACRTGTWKSQNYRVFHIFPDLTVSHLRAHWENWFIVLVQYRALSPTRSEMNAWFYPAPFAPRAAIPWYDRLTRPLSNLIRRMIMPYFVRMVLGEDNAICERQQAIARQLSSAPILGALEERLAWYEEAYAECMQTG